MRLTLDKKSGFTTSDKFIRINDSDGTPFYSFDRQVGHTETYFNLPKGVYTTTNDLKEVAPRNYKLPKFPPKERHYKISKDLRVIYAPNPHKASIIFDKALIVLDNSFKTLPRAQLVHAKLHELAHHYYKTEKYCDLWAAREMLKVGYNPSQIAFAVLGTLSNKPDSLDRKEFVLQNCEQVFK